MGGRCVAGICLDTGKWVRPVSSRPEGELHPGDCAVEGRAPRALDVVRFPYRDRLDDPAQPENALIGDGSWELTRMVEPEEAYALLRRHLQPGPTLLGGIEKGVPDSVAQEGLGASLSLVEPDSIQFVSELPFRQGGPRRARAIFDLANRWYDLGITDSVVAPRLKGAEYGTYSAVDLGFTAPTHILLTVSMTEPLNETRWKLAAAVHLLP